MNRRSKFSPPLLKIVRPRRVDRDAYRREKLGVPGPVDSWLSANAPGDLVKAMQRVAIASEPAEYVDCTVYSRRLEVGSICFNLGLTHT